MIPCIHLYCMKNTVTIPMGKNADYSYCINVYAWSAYNMGDNG